MGKRGGRARSYGNLYTKLALYVVRLLLIGYWKYYTGINYCLFPSISNFVPFLQLRCFASSFLSEEVDVLTTISRPTARRAVEMERLIRIHS